MLYEIQPFRIKPCYHRIKVYLREEFDPKATIQIALNSIQQILMFIATLFRQYCTIQSMKLYKYTIGKSILVLLLLKLYHVTLVYLHELLHAGPIFIIITLLILLYTIGLGDNTGAASGVPSAYSVFNRGMQRILGTIDAEELARQYAGGAAVQVAMGAGAGAGGEGNRQHHHHRNRDAIEDDDDENEIMIRNERRRQRRIERQRRNNQQEDGVDVIDNDNDNEDNGNDTNAIPNDTPAQEDATGLATENTNVDLTRKSGKKARRRNLELRREMQRQRQAAAANGFGRGDGDDIVAMDRLVDGFDD